jgi:N-acetylmuramoyl-L-alanine amidase
MLRRTDRGVAVTSLRASLASLGLVSPGTLVGADSLFFDDSLDAAVRAFQQQRGLIVDGVVGPITERALGAARWALGDRTLSYTLSAPMTGDDVAELQVRLGELGYNSGRADGVFGAQLDGTVREFQRHRGLADDGVFGPETLRELRRISPMATGGRPQFLREIEQVRQSGPRLGGKRIVIDPAHGGEDPGWVSDGMRTADLTFDLARRLEARMAATGMEIFLTRGAHRNPTPEERAERANELGADLVLSLDVDGSTSPLACGISAYHFGTDSGRTSTAGESLAELVQRELVARTHMVDCRVHHKPWDILRLTRMPAVLVDVGYVTNAEDRGRLAREDFRNTVADGILVAVKRLYLNGNDDRTTGTFTFRDVLDYERAARGA